MQNLQVLLNAEVTSKPQRPPQQVSYAPTDRICVEGYRGGCRRIQQCLSQIRNRQQQDCVLGTEANPAETRCVCITRQKPRGGRNG